MAISMARLRMGLVAGAVLLALVVAGFLGYARYRTHRFLASLPGKLGVDIRRETNGYTYSQSIGGKTVMTLHAAKAVERTDGKLTLHDVSMVLYGRKQDRNDRISGNEFEYEQAAGVVRAVGEVHIDLQAPARPGQPPARSAPQLDEELATDDDGRLVHVKTSGLVYIQKLAVAATDKELEFRLGGITGHAVGAEYNSDSGVLVLQSAVKANALRNGTPIVLLASYAELDRPGQRALLTDAQYLSPAQSVRGKHAILHLRADGSPERIEAEGGVTLASAATGTVSAPRGELALNARGQAETARLWSGVTYRESTSLREASGAAQNAVVAFDAAGRPGQAVLTGAARIGERTRTTASAPWSTSDGQAERLTIELATVHNRAALHTIEATGHARLTVEDAGGAAARSELAGDTLFGLFTGSGKDAQLTSVAAAGHTMLTRRRPDGSVETSAGDRLDVAFRPNDGTRRAATVAGATQTGHVTLTSAAAVEPGSAQPPQPGKATADTAVYDEASNRVTLTGHAEINEPSGTVAANRITVQQPGGDATADGDVKATYLQPSPSGSASAEPAHVLADRAELANKTGVAIFHGGVRPARLWQGASQIEAPLLEVDRQQHRLTARDAADGKSAMTVHAVLAGSNMATAEARPRPASVARIAAGRLVYSDATRLAAFTGGVLVDDAASHLRAREATAFLKPAAASNATSPASKPAQNLFVGGSVERIEARGEVELDQPGRHAAGERLVYFATDPAATLNTANQVAPHASTANDSLFVLTGTPALPPRVVDQTQGTVTGATIRFHGGDRSVEVVGADAANGGRRVHTVTRGKQP